MHPVVPRDADQGEPAGLRTAEWSLPLIRAAPRAEKEMNMDYPQLKRTVYPDSSSQTHIDQAHFRDFRDYHLPLIRLHHTHLTQGVARGLEVRGTLGETTITVEPGVAVDPQGQLLVLARAETRQTLTLLNRTLYVTLQFAERQGPDGRLEQLPAEQVRLRDAPTLDSGSDEAVVVLALVKTDGTGRVTALQVQDGARRFRRQLLGEQVEALELRRAVREGERVVDVPAGKLAAGEQGGLRLTVPGADDEILVAREDGEAFRRMEIRADVQVSGTIAGTLAADAVTSVQLAEADGTSGQETGTGQGVKTGHLQDQAVTSPKIADDTIQLGNLHPDVRRAIESGGIGDNAAVSAVIAEADGITGQLTNTGRGVKTDHLQDQAVTAPKLQSHGTDDRRRAVGRDHLQDQAVTSPKIANDTIQLRNLHPDVRSAIGGGSIGADAVVSAMIAEADGTSSQNTNSGRGVKTGHLQDRAVTSPKIADDTIQLRNLHPDVRRAIESGGIGDNAVVSAMLAEADGTSGQNTNSGQGVKTGHIQDGAVTSAKLAIESFRRQLLAGFVSFSGNGTIQNSFGVISVTRSGPGRYSINWNSTPPYGPYICQAFGSNRANVVGTGANNCILEVVNNSTGTLADATVFVIAAA